MANPRKFSEKIALHNQKQAEETAAFEQIMREVSDVTAKVNPAAPITKTASKRKQSISGDTLRITQTLGAFRGGSLPNVSGPQTVGTLIIDLKPEESLYSQPDDMTLAQFGLAAIQAHECPPSPSSPQSAKHHQQQQHHQQQHQQQYHQQRESRARGTIGPMRRPAERKVDTSPYGGSYLSPPPGDSAWRRASSDSALHQSVVQAGSQDSLGLHSLMTGGPTQQRRDSYFEHMAQPTPMDGRPRSSCEVPRVPGINIYPSAHDTGALQIPIGNNTGSLPDLTSVHFPSPLHTPLDQEPGDHSSSPYSSSPVTASPTTLSPTSLPPQRQPSARFHFSPSHSPQTMLQDIGGYSPSHNQRPNHLSVPVNHRYPHHNKVQNENTGSGYGSPYDANSGRRSLAFPGQVSPRSSTQSLYGSHGNLNLSQQSTTMHSPGVGGYRSPGLRPSPGSSPGVGAGGDSVGGVGGAGGGHSAPCSPRGAVHAAPYDPGTTYQATEDGFLITQMALQQHFEQCSMDWAQLVQSLLESGCTWTSQVQSEVSVEDVASLVNAELGQDNGYFSTSPSTMQYGHQDNTPRQTTPQTPNTPTSIPDIILTDFSNSAGGTELSKDLNSAITGHFDHNLFPSDESLREGLDPIDFDGLQMLTDPEMNVITDPSTEDTFRLDRL